MSDGDDGSIWPDVSTSTVLLLALILVGGVVTAYSLTNTVPVSGPVPVVAPDGPNVTITGSTDVNLTAPFPDAHTVELSTTSGNATLKAPGPVDLAVHESEITGTWTNLTDLGVSTNELEVNPEDKEAFNVTGATDSLSVKDSFTIDDGVVDFVYAGTSGSTTVELRGLPADTRIAAVDQNGDFLDSAMSDSNGVLRLEQMPNSEHEVTLQSSGSSSPALSDPHPEGSKNFFPTEMNVTVEDDDFPGDQVTVDFYIDGSLQGSDTVTSNGEASITITSPSRGSHTAKASATDDFGEVTNFSWTFSTPNNLTFKNATGSHEVINYETINTTFFENDEIISKKTTTGKLNLEGLPISGDIVGVAKSANFSDTPFVIEDISEQQVVYMTASTVQTYEIDFVLQDNTGGLFDNNNASLRIQKAINESSWDEPRWKTVHADEFGGDDTVTANLEQNTRHRLIVKNDQGDKRVLGSYTPARSETVTLSVGEVVAVPDAGGKTPYAINASYIQNENTDDVVEFEFSDETNETDRLYVEIYEFNNESNVIFGNQSFGGPLGSLSLSQSVPSNQQNTSWVVDVVGNRDGERIEFRRVVGGQNPVLQQLPGWLRTAISIGILFVVAGLFSQFNGSVGGVVVASLGAVLWFVGFTPPGLGLPVVVLAMIVAGIIYINDKRGSGAI